MNVLPDFFLSVPGVISIVGVVALVVAGARRSRALQTSPNEAKTVLTVQIIVSLAVLAAALYVIVAKPGATDDHKWAYSVVGTIVGYWLKASA
jgi:hypothetical protein